MFDRKLASAQWIKHPLFYVYHHLTLVSSLSVLKITSNFMTIKTNNVKSLSLDRILQTKEYLLKFYILHGHILINEFSLYVYDEIWYRKIVWKSIYYFSNIHYQMPNVLQFFPGILLAVRHIVLTFYLFFYC